MSAIRIPAMSHAANLNDVVAGADEEKPVITDPQSQLFHLALKRLDVPGARFREPMQRVQDAHGGGSIQTTDVSPGLLGPGDSLHAGSW
jgi:hypothetical protein